MKNKIITMLAIATTFVAKSQTTNEEYNYLTKGLEITIKNGLDIKKGYSLSKIFETDINNYSFKFYDFIRSKDSENAGIGIIAQSRVSGLTYFYCLPIDNDELMDTFYSRVSLLDEPMTTAMLIATSKFVASTYAYSKEAPMENPNPR